MGAAPSKAPWEGGGVYVIAEIGTAHSGDLAKARGLVRAARDSGADCAKYQYVIAREILHPAAGLVPLPGGDTPLFGVFESLERPPSFYAELRAMTKEEGLDFLCTPFGPGSARALREIGVSMMKVASPELNHEPLLAELAGYGLPTILSSGVSRLGDIERALSFFSGPVALLHCVTAYPAPPEDYNLRLLPALARIFGAVVGVSDHSLDPCLVPCLALAQGARIVEKHFTASRSGGGLDDPIALEPASFARMCARLRSFDGLPGGEIASEVAAEYGMEIVEAVLGDGRKRLAPSEEANYERTNRSLHALRRIAAGEAFTEDNVGVLRTEKVLGPGAAPGLLGVVLGRKALRDVEDGQGICFGDF